MTDAVTSVRVPSGYELILYDGDGRMGLFSTITGMSDEYGQDECQSIKDYMKGKTSSLVVTKLPNVTDNQEFILRFVDRLNNGF